MSSSQLSVARVQLAPARSLFCSAVLVTAVVIWMIGCKSPKATAHSDIDQLHILVTSVALNLDGKPGADGVGVRVYASHRGDTEAIAITSGTLDILLYDASVPLEDLPSRPPRKTWNYSAAELKRQMQQTSIGVSYRFAATWGTDTPAGDRITLVARYTALGGKVVYSAPSSVPMTLD